MLTIQAREGQDLPLGRQGENLARRVAFDIRDWVSLYGSGNVQLLFQRPGDSAPYPILLLFQQPDNSTSGSDPLAQSGPVPIATDESYLHTVVWNVSAADTKHAGQGRAELRYYAGDTLVKSAVFRTSITPALTTPETQPPAPGSNWAEGVLSAASRAERAAQDAALAADGILGAADRAERAAFDAALATAHVETVQLRTVTLEPGTPASVSAVSENGVRTMTFSIPAGEKGDKGDRGDPGATGDKGDKGDPGATGNKGDKGDPGATGAKGDKGDKGDPGATGDKGDKGDPGAAGADGNGIAYMDTSQTIEGQPVIVFYFTDGTHSDPITLPKGPKGDKGDRGATGAAGEKGDKGDPGDDANIPPASAAPSMDGTAAVGASVKYAREDHVHPTDTSRASTAVATSSADGLMSSADKAKLDSISPLVGDASFPVTLSNQALAAVQSAAANRPLHVTAHIEPAQSGSGNPSASNVRPIPGWTSANVTIRGGKNHLIYLQNLKSTSHFFFTPENEAGFIGISRRTGVQENETFDVSEEFGNLGLIDGEAYTFTNGQSYQNAQIRWAIIDLANSGNIVTLLPVGGSEEYTFTYNAASMNKYRLVAVCTTTTGLTTSNNYRPLLRKADQSNAWERSNCRVYYNSFPSSVGTVYGGTLNFLTGVLTVTHKYFEIAGTDGLNAYGSDGTAFYKRIEDIKIGGSIVFENASGEASNVEGYPLVILLDRQTNETANAYLSRHGGSVRGVYQLSTPLTYQFTPQRILTLAGDNHVTANCGPVDVTHWPGTGTPVELVDDGAETASINAIMREIEELRNAIIEGGN